jgi:hypothetical protein
MLLSPQITGLDPAGTFLSATTTGKVIEVLLPLREMTSLDTFKAPP